MFRPPRTCIELFLKPFEYIQIAFVETSRI
jgi:hypothetical protein